MQVVEYLSTCLSVNIFVWTKIRLNDKSLLSKLSNDYTLYFNNHLWIENFSRARRENL